MSIGEIMHRYMVFFIASVLPLLFVGRFAPGMAGQLDFWLLWLLAMILVGLPVLLAEFALSARSETTPWQGMQKLTREADAHVFWRAFAFLSVLMAFLMTALIAAGTAKGLTLQLPGLVHDLGAPVVGLAAALAVVSLILSPLKEKLLPVGALLLFLGTAAALLDNDIGLPVLTQVSLSEWARAVLLALMCLGVGTGLYWFGGTGLTTKLMQSKKPLSSYVLPIWLIQLAFGSFALISSTALVSPISFSLTSLGMMLVAGFLVYYAAGQLLARFGWLIGLATTIVLVLLLSVLPVWQLNIMVAIVGLALALLLVVFSGFVMKISHLRKSLNFKTELRYNLWRVLVRIVVPFAVISALVGLVMDWLAL